MKRIRLGEGHTFFPYFFILFAFFSSPVAVQILGSQAEGENTPQLSRFDRLAQEAAELNQAKDFDKTIALLEPLKKDPKNDSSLFFNELGVAYRNRGRLVDSIQAYQAALARHPDNPAVIQKNLGDALCFNKEYEKAISEYKQVIQQNPRFQQARFSLGYAYYQSRRYDEALSEFETALRLNPRDEKAREFRDATLQKLKKK
jgi:tetratricopeptide (TPR) repeat protein